MGAHISLENWLPWLRRGNPFIPRSGPWQPGDYDGGERITRERVAFNGVFPYPWMTGTVSGFMPMLDNYSMAWAYARPAFGPGVQTPIPVPFDQQFPQLTKVSG